MDKFRVCWTQVTDVKNSFLKRYSNVFCCSGSTLWEARPYLHHYSMTFLSPSTDHPIFGWVGTLNCVFPEPLTTSLLIEKWGVATPCSHDSIQATMFANPWWMPRKLKWTFWKTNKAWERALLVLLHGGTKHNKALRTRTTWGPTHVTSTKLVGTGRLSGSENPKETQSNPAELVLRAKWNF